MIGPITDMASFPDVADSCAGAGTVTLPDAGVYSLKDAAKLRGR